MRSAPTYPRWTNFHELPAPLFLIAAPLVLVGVVCQVLLGTIALILWRLCVNTGDI